MRAFCITSERAIHFGSRSEIWTPHLDADGCHCGRNAYPEAARDCHLERRGQGGWVGDEFVGGKRAGEGDVMQIARCPGGCLNVKHIKVTDMLFFRAATGPGCSFGARALSPGFAPVSRRRGWNAAAGVSDFGLLEELFV